MNFQHTEERQMLARTLDRFVVDHYGFDVRERIAWSAAGHDADLWSRFAHLGAIGALVPEEAGGFGGAGFDILVVFEALGRGLVVEPFLSALMSARALSLSGDRSDLIEGIVAGDAVVAFAHREAEPDTLDTTAERTSDGWVLDGTKTVVAQLASADQALVSATRRGSEGASLFLVPLSAEGVVVRTYANIDGGRSGDLSLTGVVLPAEAMIGTPDQAAPIIAAVEAAGRLALSAEALGAMEVARDATLEFLRSRMQFGKPLGEFQALQHRVADLWIEIEQARSAVINAAAALESDDWSRDRAGLAAKHTIGRIGLRVAEEAIQLHGGIGMTWELPLSHYAKRLILIDHQLDDEDDCLARYIALGRARA